jgi:hypothetical protein
MLSRAAIRKIFKEHAGTAAQVARENDWTRAHVSQWLSGKRQSKAVHAACNAMAERLLKGERQ